MVIRSQPIDNFAATTKFGWCNGQCRMRGMSSSSFSTFQNKKVVMSEKLLYSLCIQEKEEVLIRGDAIQGPKMFDKMASFELISI
jgi:hypothetical protein